MIGFEHFVVGTYRDNVHILPYLFSFSRSQSLDGSVFIRFGTGKVGKQSVGEIDGYFINCSVFRRNTEGFGGGHNLVSA